MIDFLEKFETSLEKEKMQGQLRMLNFACAAKARKRTGKKNLFLNKMVCQKRQMVKV